MMCYQLYGTALATLCSCQNPDPCTSAVNIGDWRRSTLCIPDLDKPLLSDSNLNPNIWYKFDAYSGNKMPETCIGIYHCGTYGPIWLNGQHPTANNPGPVDVPVCAQDYSGNCCAWSSQISVTRCKNNLGEEFFVYKLVPSVSQYAYCAGDGIVCNDGSTWSNITQQCMLNPVMNVAPRLDPPYISEWEQVPGFPALVNATRFSVDCVINYPQATEDDGVRFKVLFKMDNEVIANFVAKSIDPVVSLDEQYLHGHLGKTLTCVASAYIQSYYPDPEETTPLQSNGRWFGVQPVDTNNNVITTAVPVPVGQNYIFRLRPTFPLTFAHCIVAGFCFPAYQFQVTTQKTDLTQCTIVFNQNKLTSEDIVVSPGSIFLGPTSQTGTVSFVRYPAFQPTQIFNEYKIDDVQVVYFDNRPKPFCSSYNDPHITTFANAYYDIHLVGDFYLLKATSTNIEVQIRYVPCNAYTTICCNCGVIAREGNNILGISSCDGLPTPLRVQYLKDTVSPGGTITQSGNSYTISLPSGVTVNVLDAYGSLMNVNVYGLNNEMWEGICSNKTSYSTDKELVRVPPVSSFFRLSESNPPKCVEESYEVAECHCQGRENGGSINVTCENANDANQVLLLKSKYSCSGSIRRKRATFADEDDDYISLDYINSKIDHSKDTYVENINAVWPTPSGITQQQATDRCNIYFQSLPAYPICSEYSNVPALVQTCVFDIQLTDDLESVHFSDGQLENNCLYDLKSLIVVNDDPPDAVAQDLQNKADQVQSTLCQNGCRNGGSCVNSTCSCLPGFIGSDCSLTDGQQPTVQELISDMCDVRQNPCRTIYVSATGVLDSDRLTCKFESVIAGIQYSVGTYVPGNLVYCTLPSNYVSTPDDDLAVTSYSVAVSISNDQSAYSNSKTYTVYDGLCISCEAGVSSCQQMPATCAIRGRCFAEGAVCQFDSNKICDSSKCSNKWSSSTTTSCDDGDDVCGSIMESTSTTSPSTWSTTLTPSTQSSTSTTQSTTSTSTVSTTLAYRCIDQDNRNGFVCDDHHPCTTSNIGNSCYLFPHTDIHNYIRCDGVNLCNVVPCDPGYVWNKPSLQCVPGTR
jgi:hypothetical protein